MKNTVSIVSLLGFMALVGSCGDKSSSDNQAFGGVNQNPDGTVNQTDSALRGSGGHGMFVTSKNPTARLFYAAGKASTGYDAACSGVLLAKHPSSTKRFVLTSRTCLRHSRLFSDDPNSNLVQRVGFGANGASQQLKVVRAYVTPSSSGTLNVYDSSSLALLELESKANSVLGTTRAGINLSHAPAAFDKLTAIGYGSSQKNTWGTNTGKLVRIDAEGRNNLATSNYFMQMWPTKSGLSYGDEGAPVFALKYGTQTTGTASVIPDNWYVTASSGTTRTYRPIEIYLLGVATQNIVSNPSYSYVSYKGSNTTSSESPKVWVNSVVNALAANSAVSTTIATTRAIPQVDIEVTGPSQVANLPVEAGVNDNAATANDFCTQAVQNSIFTTGLAQPVAIGMDYNANSGRYINTGSSDADVIKLCVPIGKSVKVSMSKGGVNGLPALAELSSQIRIYLSNAVASANSASFPATAKGTYGVNSVENDSSSFEIFNNTDNDDPVYLKLTGNVGNLYLLLDGNNTPTVPNPSSVASQAVASDRNGTEATAGNYCSQLYQNALASGQGIGIRVMLGMDYNSSNLSWVNTGNNDIDMAKVCIPRGKKLKVRPTKGGEMGLALLAERTWVAVSRKPPSSTTWTSPELRYSGDITLSGAGNGIVINGSTTAVTETYIKFTSGMSSSPRGQLWFYITAENL